MSNAIGCLRYPVYALTAKRGYLVPVPIVLIYPTYRSAIKWSAAMALGLLGSIGNQALSCAPIL